MKHYIILGSVLWSLGACSNETAPSSHESQLSSAVEISNARIRPPLPGQKIAAGYFKLESTKGDKLLAVTSSASSRVELHNHINDSGVMRMRRVDSGVSIPAGGFVEFNPGGYHVMLFDAQVTDQTETILLTFDFENADDVTVVADIMSGNHSASGSPQGSGHTKGEDDKKSYGSGH